MEKQILLKGYVKEVGEDGILEAAVASTDIVDRHGEVVKQDGWQLDNFNKNPVLLWSHNAAATEARPPIGKVNRIWIDGDRLMFQPQFDLEDSFAKEIFRKYKSGYLNSFSVGMLPTEVDGDTFVKQELLEISAVPVPANPEANVYLRSKGMKTQTWEDLIENKAVVRYQGFPPADEGRPWNAAAAKKRLFQRAGGSWSKYGQGFAWFDSADSEKKGAYKLPHHDVSEGKMVTVWRGVSAAMGALMGARGGVDIPSSDKRGVYNHLKKHYKQFGKDAPDFKLVEAEVLKDVYLDTIPENEIIEVVRLMKKRIDGLEAQLKKCKPKRRRKDVDDMSVLEIKELALVLNKATSKLLHKIKRGGEKIK